MIKNYIKLSLIAFLILLINLVKAQCPIPSLVTASPSTIICAGSSTLNATALGATIGWFTVPVGGTTIGSSASGANFVVTPTATTTYYAESFISPSGTTTFNYTGGAQFFTVPLGVTSLTVDVYGAAGFGLLGYGGRVQAIYPVTPGAVLQINVGGAGSALVGGFNGGGNGSGNASYGSGGGASDIRLSPYALANREIVAGGGGGSGSNCGLYTAEGGDGGGLIGVSGCVYSCSSCQYTGSGGSQIAGGIAGPTPHGSCGGNQNGLLGQGGSNTSLGFGTGGGGGYYGGGSGCFEGAGGGSSYTSPSSTGVIHTQGVRTGNGQVIITGSASGCVSVSRTPITVVVVPSPIPSLVTASPSTICAGSSTLNATAIGASIDWYTLAVGGSTIGSSASGANFVVTPTVTTTYYAESSVVSGGPSVSQTFAYTGTIQNYTVPAGVTSLTIQALGAQGGNHPSSGVPAGLGANIKGSFIVTPGAVLKILVGQCPTGANGGGGGSFVTDLLNNPFVVAGGGSGSAELNDSPNKHGQVGTAGGTGVLGGGTGGTAGNGGNTGATFASGAGGGLLTSGIAGWTPTSGGKSFVIGGAGGTGGAVGGFGGGGSGSAYIVGAGGGGYSGGGSGTNSSGSGGVAGGGGSFNGGTSQVNVGGVNIGNGQVIITGSSIGGCVSISRTPITVVVGTTPTISVSSGSICSGSSFTIVPGGASTYTIQGGSTIVSPVINTTYSVVGTSSLGCVGSNTAICSVIINPNPTITVSSGTICSGTSFTMVPLGALSYTFQGGSSVVSPVVSTTYTISGTNASGCLGVTSCSVTVVSAASITVSPLTSTICLGQSTNLIATGGATYTWTASSGATPPSVSNVTVSPLVNTTYTVLSGSGTCTAQAVSSVVVSPAFSLIGAPSSTTICSGGPGVVLTVSGATSYTWSGVGLSTTTGSIVTATPLVNTTYTVLGDNGSCSSATLITVNVTSVSTTVTASATSYCTGGPAVSLTGSGATTYSWSPAAGLSSTTGAIVTATPTISTIYTVVGTTGLCTSTKTISITVSTTTSLSIASTGTIICPGSSGVTLTGLGASTYTWLPGATSVNPLLVNPATTTIYTLTGTSAGGCLSVPAVITVSVLPAISPVLSSSSASVCLTKTVTLSATPVGAGYSYTWSPGSAIQGPVNGASIVAKPISAASPVIYTLLISNGVCVETSTIALNVIVCSPPVSSFNTLTNDSICTGGCVTFTATSSGTPPLTYQWFFAGGTPPFSTLASPQVCYFAAGNYTVALVTANPFGTDTIIKLNYINVADTPSVVRGFGDTLIKIGQVAPIHATGATYYQWTPNNGTIACPSCSNTVVQPTVTTQYIVIGSNSPYCKRQDTIIVKVDFTCGDFFVPNVFSPNADGLNDVITVNGFCIGTFNLKIFSRWGEKVFETSEKSNGWDGTYKGKPMDTGVFIYKVDGITIDGKPFVIKGNITLLR